jgi:hypothetical protein
VRGVLAHRTGTERKDRADKYDKGVTVSIEPARLNRGPEHLERASA